MRPGQGTDVRGEQHERTCPRSELQHGYAGQRLAHVQRARPRKAPRVCSQAVGRDRHPHTLSAWGQRLRTSRAVGSMLRGH